MKARAADRRGAGGQGDPATGFALGAAMLLIAEQVAGKATRDAVFLSHFDATALPRIVMLSALLSMGAVIVASRLLARHGPSRVIPAALALSAMLFGCDWLLYGEVPRLVAVLLYVQQGIFGAVLISGFWSVVNERFDPHAAKQTIARIAAAATLGGVVGGLVAGKVARSVDVQAMLLVLGAIHVLCAFLVRGIGEPSRAAHSPAPLGAFGALRLLITQGYLREMGMLMVFGAMLAALLDYALKSTAAVRFPESGDLVAFFGQFYAAVGVLTFVLQWLLGPRVLRRFGLGATLAVMPAAVVLTGLLGAAAARWWTVVLVRGLQVVCANSFFRSAFELLYTPLPPFTKRPTKMIIDVAADRLGDVLGSSVLILVLALVSGPALELVLVLGVVIALVSLAVVARLYRGYVAQLAASLREGAIALSDEQAMDATTRHILAEVSAASERAQLGAKIRRMKYERHGVVVARGAAAPEALPGDTVFAVSFARAVADLSSGDHARIRRCLAGEFMDRRLAPFLVQLLGVDLLAEDVRMELRWMAPSIIGLLADALVDPDVPLAARQRIPSVLEVTHSPRAVAVLVMGLSEEEFNIRYSCARALARMSARDPYMEIDPERILEAVEREVRIDDAAWSARDLHDRIDLPFDLAAGTVQRESQIGYSLDYVFTLLELVLDRDALTLALQAMYSGDRNLRGTALEYLENVLPAEVLAGLWPHLGEAVPAARSRRSNGDLVEDLKRRVQKR